MPDEAYQQKPKYSTVSVYNVTDGVYYPIHVHHQFCRTNVTKNSGINIGIKLCNKLPPVIKNLEMTQEFKSRVKDFLMQHMFYSVEEFLSF